MHEAEPSSRTPRDNPVRALRAARRAVSYAEQDWADEEDGDVAVQPRRSSRRARGLSRSMDDFVAPDDDDDVDGYAEYGETISAQRAARAAERSRRRENLQALASTRNVHGRHGGSSTISSARGGFGSRRRGREVQDEDESASETPSSAEESDTRQKSRAYSFRTRKKINYSLIPAPSEPLRDGFGRRVRRSNNRANGGSVDLDMPFDALPADARSARPPSLPMSMAPRGMRGGGAFGTLPLSMTGRDYAALAGDPADSSDDEPPAGAALGGNANIGAPGVLLGNGPTPAGGADLNSATDSFGRIKSTGDALADVDPLGVGMNIDFSHVGGLDHHVQQLKEMVSLPLLYPEVFQRFTMTPPRGVLFHGPPGTGKTLVARALAASCSTADQPISFFMRKGADCLSKWVGEAERQLRLLFEEAKKSQPSIIFFDEIDGLAPVRSSKQDQIHASIVSTLLALMDGMDGRGQVVVIGATNRPDSVDPALRRPGRFDREFYFPLPSKEARRSILDIHTRTWEPALDDDLKDVLAETTKGYGGADLRALCTEATLNAIQRCYPQIYHTSDRLELQPDTITVDGHDFMLALDKVVPSSARSVASVAAALPVHLTPLLGRTTSEIASALKRAIPRKASRNALEEAMWEVDVAPSQHAAAGSGRLEQEIRQQELDRARVYRPRFLVHGDAGHGQSAIGAALLHHIEGYHVQSVDVTALLGDSSQTPEAVLVRLFNEARRLKPSVLYIPELDRWARIIPEATRELFSALLDGASGNESLMLLAVSNVAFAELPRDVRSWFELTPRSRMETRAPSVDARRAYFADVSRQAARPPTEFADALPKRRRVLEELPKAAPRPPRMPTQLEIREQADHDARLLEHLKFRLGPVLAELRKKFKKFSRDVWDEYNLRELIEQFDWRREKGKVVITLRYEQDTQNDRDSSAERAGPVNEDTIVDHGSVALQPEDAADQTATSGAATDNASASTDVLGTAPDAPADAPSDAEEQPAAPGATEYSGVNGEAEHIEETEDAHYVLRDLTIYTMTLDKMQKKLYYNAYLTSGAFLEDIDKIVANAEEAKEVDSDRVFRARQMRNLAVILIDQYVDPAFRSECEAMAKRVAASREEEQRNTKRAEEQKQAAHPQRPGLRSSARMQGVTPGTDSLVDISAIERLSKRSRSVSQPMPLEETADPDDDTSDAKRARLETDDTGTDDTPAADREPDTAVRHSRAPAEHVLSTAEQDALTETLLHKTATFNVEQLEQTRAACIDAILMHRSSWDRSQLVADLQTLAEEMREAVAGSSDAAA